MVQKDHMKSNAKTDRKCNLNKMVYVVLYSTDIYIDVVIVAITPLAEKVFWQFISKQSILLSEEYIQY